MKMRQRNDGFILVAALWILCGLGGLAAVYALYVVNAATSLEVNNERIQANAPVSGALELTAYYWGAVKEEEPPTAKRAAAFARIRAIQTSRSKSFAGAGTKPPVLIERF